MNVNTSVYHSFKELQCFALKKLFQIFRNYFALILAYIVRNTKIAEQLRQREM